jgi:hypothetical protein
MGHSIVQGGGKNADAVLLIVCVLFSRVKTRLNGTFHGVNPKHLPRYAREWTTSFAAAGSPISAALGSAARPCARRIRCTELTLMPTALDIISAVQ